MSLANIFCRRDFLRLNAAGACLTGLSGWLNVLAANTNVPGKSKKHKSCILLWMDGGPSHKDTFDMKPDSKDAGEFKQISTAVPGIQISEHFPKLAGLMNHVAILRGMSTPEGAHPRAKYHLHTGYREGQGGLIYPSIGSLVASELGNPESPVPNFVSVGNRVYGSGFLGAKHQPLTVNDPARGVENLNPLVSQGQFDRRLSLLEQMENGFFDRYNASASNDHKTTYDRAVKLMRSKEAQAFDLGKEPEAIKTRYGTGKFAEGCLLARRLVEVGIPFVEVSLGGWDTHQDNFDRVKKLSQTVDQPMAALIDDLKSRGMLDSTLIIWMGEFGRTPKINQRGAKPGRDHYPKAWSSLMIGGGIRGGQVIGKTDKEGATVVDRPISVLDFLATVCTILGVDHNKRNEAPGGRPIRIVDKGANPIKELVG